MKNLQFLLFCAVFILGYACSSGGGETKTTTTDDEPKEEKKEEVVAATEEKPVNEAGKTVYLTYCNACHQQDGGGVPGLNPPLIGTEWVNGDKERLIGVVLNGLNGEIEIDGEKYNGVMASHAFLNDQQVADVLTYVRQSFGNNSSEVTAAEVAEVRAANGK